MVLALITGSNAFSANGSKRSSNMCLIILCFVIVSFDFAIRCFRLQS